MNQPFKRNYLQHALAVGRWMRLNAATGSIDPLTYVLEIRCDGREQRFQPQFILERPDGQVGFTPQLAPNVSGFVGWLPYFNKTWPIAQDKQAFKEFAIRVGIATPIWVADPEATRGAFIVKVRRSTFGRGLRGPFEARTTVPMGDGEYCEQFIAGKLLKAWFWNDQLAVAELVDMPGVRGDGLRTLRQLISGRLGSDDPFPNDLEALASIQGLSLDAVVTADRIALADYRYMSVLNPARMVDHDVRQAIAGGPLEAQLLSAGAHCWAAVLQEMRDGTAFSLDGIVDAKGKIWFLEANCNPQFHPAFYDAMLNSTFQAEKK